jgi:transcriptional regulator with XRE-family HTH domain
MVDAKKYLENLSGGPLTFGKVLKSHRLAEEWSQQDLADRIGISKMAISKLESGKMLPSPETLKTISKIFGVKVESLLRYVLQDYAALYGNFQVELKKVI